jgi:pilus assembly protein Flp/PilA
MTNLLSRLTAASRDEEGQTLIEYGLIVALISIVAIAALGLIGTNVTDVFNSVAGDLKS